MHKSSKAVIASVAKQSRCYYYIKNRDCFVAPLLAKTAYTTSYEIINNVNR
jgi:hypothetical protein